MFHASIQEGRSRIVRFVSGFCCAITTSPSVEAGSLNSRSVKEGEGLRPCRAGYRDSGNRVSKSMYSPRRIFCFTFSGSGGWWGAGEVLVVASSCAAGRGSKAGGGGGWGWGWGWGCASGDGREMLSASADGARGRRELRRRSSIPCMLFSTRVSWLVGAREGVRRGLVRAVADGERDLETAGEGCWACRAISAGREGMVSRYLKSRAIS